MAELGRAEEARRETERDGDAVRPRPAFTPAQRWLSEHQRAARTKNVTIAVLLAGLLVSWLTVRAAVSDQKAIVIDPVGGVTVGPLESLSNSRGFFDITTINATQVALQRSTVGFDLQDLLPLYFTSRARRTLDEDQSHRAEEVRRRHLSTKPVISQITPPEPAGDAKIVKVAGKLQITGVVNGRVFYDDPPFELLLVFRSNADLANRAAMPWLVDEIDLAVASSEINALHARNRPRA